MLHCDIVVSWSASNLGYTSNLSSQGQDIPEAHDVTSGTLLSPDDLFDGLVNSDMLVDD